jgi:hypothetical protein
MDMIQRVGYELGAYSINCLLAKSVAEYILLQEWCTCTDHNISVACTSRTTQYEEFELRNSPHANEKYASSGQGYYTYHYSIRQWPEFLCSSPRLTDSGARQVYYQLGTGGESQTINRPGHEEDRSPLPSAEVKNV